MRSGPTLQAILAAGLFGLSTPVAKWLGLEAHPLVGAAMLYSGAGIALALVMLGARLVGHAPREARLQRRDLPFLGGVIVAGGLAGPLLLLYGLQTVSAASTSLLLNLETPFTALVAVAIFHEHLGRRGMLAIGLIAAGAAALGGGVGGVASGGQVLGMLAIAGACAAWALDNNLTQRLSLRDPVVIVAAKGLGAGGMAWLLVLATGAPLPALRTLALGLALGALAYGVSLVLYVRALRGLGAARVGALFATAPFVGAAAAIPLLGESASLGLALAGVLMAGGVALLVAEGHEHRHHHHELLHDHLHEHDEHHQHEHTGDEGPAPHAHPHVHRPLVHAHPHASDVHHRHEH